MIDKLAAAKERALRMAEWAHGAGGLFEAFDAAQKSYTKTLLASDIEDAGLRERVYHRINALADVRRVMELVISEGKAADAIIERQNKLEARARKKTG